MRLLSNAHATPHRLHKQNIVPTPACTFCGCEDADVLHNACHCPRFQLKRAEWSDITHTWPFWPACSQHCLIATTTFPMHTRKNWSTVQQDIARLLETWMAFRRNGVLVQNITCESHALEIPRDEGARASQPEASNWIDLEWKPPNSSWALSQMGRFPQRLLRPFFFLEQVDNRALPESHNLPQLDYCHRKPEAIWHPSCMDAPILVPLFGSFVISPYLCFPERGPTNQKSSPLILNRTTRFIGVLACHLPDPFLITLSQLFNGI